MNIHECLENGYLKKVTPDKELVQKELSEASHDLESAKKAFSDHDYKWCIVQSYYAMFHSAKAVLFTLGYSEKRHIAIVIVLEDLSKNGKLESTFITHLKAAMSAREDADYHYSYSKETAEHEIETAEEFVNRMEILTSRLCKK
ncbi:MAG: HEPN domain-containing protein [Candidatus Woesearchaeota archaeon]